MATQTSTDLPSLLINDHRLVQNLYQQFVSATSPNERKNLAELIIRSLSTHDFLEREYLYPTLYSYDKSMRDKALYDHDEVTKMMYAIEKMDKEKDTQGFAFKMQELMQSVDAHISEEEDSIFPLLRMRCSREQLVQLGDKAESARTRAPTHPHPLTPLSGVGATVMGTVAGMTDKVRDRITGHGSNPLEE